MKLDYTLKASGVDADMIDYAIRAQGLSKIYRLYDRPVHQFLDAMGMRWAIPKSAHPKEYHALADVNLSIPKGARMGLIGRNGAGKTTLLKLLTGNFLPTAGHLETHGKVIALIEIGAGFHPEFSGLENIRSSLAFNGLPQEDFEAAVEDVIDFCELGPFLGQPLKTYSLGMKSRLYFACATAVKPDILIIDEVLGAGDTYFGIKSAERMQKLTSSGCTLLLVSHSIAQIMQFCDDAVWLEQGRVVSKGKAIEVVKLYDEFIRELDNTRLTRVAGSVLAESNEWLRRQIVDKVVARRSESQSAPQLGAKPSPQKPRHDAPETKELCQVGSSAATDGARAAGTMQDIVSDGGISRWPGAAGPKVDSVSLLSQVGPTAQFITGDMVTIRLHVTCNDPGAYRCRYSVLLFTQDLRWICRFHSPVHQLESREGSVSYDVDLVLDKLQLSNGEYILTVGIFDDHELDRIENAVRYDNLSLSFRFRVVDPIKSEQAIFHHPCTWQIAKQEGVEELSQEVLVGLP